MNHAQSPQPRGTFFRPFLVLTALGLIGVVALYPTLEPVARQVAALPEAPDVALPLLQLILLVNPVLLLLAGVAVGTALAPRVGLRSHLAAWAGADTEPERPLKAQLPLALGLGVLAGVLIVVLDFAFRPLLGEAADALAALAAEQPRTLVSTLAGMLYGGITEELMMRWGLMSLLAWIGWRVLQRGRGEPLPAIMWSALVVAAVLFGIGHLGAIGAQLPLTGPLVLRTVALNAAGGIVFGWLFWRRSLEAAMIAHASGHVVFTLFAWLAPAAGAA